VPTVRSVCAHNCPDTCGLVVEVDDAGEIRRVDGDPDHPITRGFICEKVRRYPEHVRSAHRVLYPQRRIGPKGAGLFARISWDEALDAIAARLTADVATHGPESIVPYSFSGTLGIVQSASMDRRFFHRLGASRLARTICSAAAETALAHTYGAALGVDPERTIDAKLIVAWGMNLRSTNIHQFALVQEARKNGARLVVVDPHRNRTAEGADLHLQLEPGTDAALALALMHVIFRDGLADRAFLAAETVGADDLEARAAEWSPERAAAVCGVDVATIESFAREYATTHPSIVRAGYGFQRHANGGQAVRAVACLTAVVGAERHGGGFLLSQSGAFRYDRRAMERPDLQPAGDTRTINMIGLGDALLHASDPPIATLFVYNANPATVNPDGNAVARGLMRDDLFTVVHDIYHTDTARYADILLPAPTFLETEDVYTSYWHRYLQYAPAAIAPRGESWSNVRLFAALAKRMGFTDACFDDDEAALVRTMLASRALRDAGVDHARLTTERRVKMPAPQRKRRIALRAETLARAGVDPVPQHVPLRESRAGSPALAARYPLAFLTPSHHLFLNSNFGSDERLRARAVPSVRIHPADAAARGIVSGDTVTIANDRGRTQLIAEVTDAVKPGTLVHLSLWWNAYSPAGANANATTSQAESDLGGGATFHTNLVEVAKMNFANERS
jgi:anaerobic selenocysteine-containing dehydrogenase